MADKINSKQDLRIALCIIAKDKEKIIERMLESTKGVFDIYCLQDTGSSDKTVEKFQQWCVKNNKISEISKKLIGKEYKAVYPNGNATLGDFASARNDSFELAKKQYAHFAFWMDTDDILENPEQIRELAWHMHTRNIAGAILPYTYAQMKEGIRLVDQKRERLLNLAFNGEWVGRVHETYRHKIAAELTQTDAVRVVHMRTGGEWMQTGRRNKLIMESEIEEVGIDNVDLNVIRNLAYDHYEYSEWEECIKYYTYYLDKVLQLDGDNSQMLFDIYLHLAKAYLGMGATEECVKYAFLVQSIAPRIADGYLLSAKAYAMINNWEEVEKFADKVLRLGKPDVIGAVNEVDYTILPLQMKLQSNLARGRVKEGLEIVEELLRILPNNETFREQKRLIKKELLSRDAITGLNNILRYIQAENRTDWNDRLIDAIPVSLLTNDTVRKLIYEAKYDYKRKTKKIKFSGPKEIHFFAGQHGEPWDGVSDITKGIGGSEGMCIQIARELAALGNKVIVYNECGDSDGKEIDNVLYLDWRRWNPKLKCDVLVSLRRPDVFSQLLKAKKCYLWLHDTYYGEQPITSFYSPNKVIVLSDYHKEVIKSGQGVEDSSIFWVSRNALNKHALETADVAQKPNGKDVDFKMTRNPYKVIYASSYDRGLVNALKEWPKVKAAVPDAELHIYYGWNTYDMMMKAREGTPEGRYMAKQKEEIDRLMCQDGVIHHGRVSQDELYTEFATSNIWYYPTEFPEISCITAMQAQALGAVPLCTPFAALKETVNSKYGFKVELDKCTETLIYLLQNQEELEKRREPMMKWAREQYDVRSLAKSWDEFFNND